MLMRIVRTRAKPGMWPDFEREFFSESPRITGIPGQRGRWILRDLDDRAAGFVVAIWDSMAEVLAFERAVERHHLLTHPLPGEFEFHLCEIRSAWVAPEHSESSDRMT